MQKQLFGIALILFGILVSFSGITLDIPVSIPWGFIGIALGICGLAIAFKNSGD